jgi:hypothetical protein
MARPNSAPRVDAAQRDAQALELRADGASYRQIANRLGISVSTAWACVERGLDRTRREPADRLRELELERLDRLQVEATKILAGRHVVIQAGKVVVDKHGDPYADHGPTLTAIRTLVQVQESRRKLLGLDAPAKHDLRARMFTIDELDMQIAELETLLGERAEAEGVDLYPRKHKKAGELVDELAARNGIDAQERAVVHERVITFWNAWKADQRAIRNVEEFVAEALEVCVHVLALPADEEETLAAGIERFLVERAR